MTDAGRIEEAYAPHMNGRAAADLPSSRSRSRSDNEYEGRGSRIGCWWKVRKGSWLDSVDLCDGGNCDVAICGCACLNFKASIRQLQGKLTFADSLARWP